MKRIVFLIGRSILIVLVLLFLGFLYLWVFHAYKEKDFKLNPVSLSQLDLSHPDIDQDGILNIEDIVANARKLKGVFYEYFKGKYGNIGRKLGFLVCIDIPLIAYKKAGIDFESLLQYDFQIHSQYYHQENGNNLPNSSFFFRRTRNLYSFCQANDFLIQQCNTPKPGDLLFYGKYHIAMVSEVHDNGTYNEIENAPWTIFTVEHKNKTWQPMDVGRIFQ